MKYKIDKVLEALFNIAIILTFAVLLFTLSLILYAGLTVEEETSDFYYYQAEVVSQSDGTVVFGGVDVENPQLFAWKSTSESINIDVPYLLTMDGKGTETMDDDEILVVWACVN